MNLFRVSLMSLVFSLSLSACASRPENVDAAAVADPAHGARNALDWPGTYRGVLPCADCEGIETVVVLKADDTYVEYTKYLGEGDIVFLEEGAFTWNDAGDSVQFEGLEPSRYFVGENQLTRLALDGSPISGELASNYALSKLPLNILGRRWRLVELNGRPLPELERAPYLMLDEATGRVEGFGGCNEFSGGYTLDAAVSRIRFNDLVNTLRACVAGMEVEAALQEVLRNTDNYSLSGNELALNRARMAPLARFEAVYLF
ncbi:MAG: copper resistance protein NlpE N-terminal domain-containing protein [Pseudomonadales bacterium]|jgi:heat shock protein HslJ|nr:copper resistance protein NlpE N-terminal domain-containing protein [Pseudomonadales bacterium]